jgi:hypothetical protein
VIEANRGAGQAAISATREVVQRNAPKVESAVNGVRARAAGTARKATRETKAAADDISA